jgi:hypothetical protein
MLVAIINWIWKFFNNETIIGWQEMLDSSKEKSTFEHIQTNIE